MQKTGVKKFRTYLEEIVDICKTLQQGQQEIELSLDHDYDFVRRDPGRKLTPHENNMRGLLRDQFKDTCAEIESRLWNKGQDLYLKAAARSFLAVHPELLPIRENRFLNLAFREAVQGMMSLSTLQTKLPLHEAEDARFLVKYTAMAISEQRLYHNLQRPISTVINMIHEMPQRTLSCN